ncbi:helix-turn-helix domain-containing protein [Verrucomicrobiota bacterium]
MHIESVDPDFYSALEKHEWPGNARELRNMIESAVILASSPRLKASDLKFSAQDRNSAPIDSRQSGQTLAEMEKAMILNALKLHNGSRTLAARELDTSTRTIQRKIKDYNLPF